MLSVSAMDYYVPVQISQDNMVSWRLDRRGSDEFTSATKFNYTAFFENDKATFIYDGPSVKPSPRTLRVFGSEWTSKAVSILSRNQSPKRKLGLQKEDQI